MYSHVEIKTFIGLYLQQNSFAVPDGALEVAENCVITLDNVISKRRGYFAFFSPGSGTLNNLALYQHTLIDIYTNKIGHLDDNGSETINTGVAVVVTPPRVSRTAQANDNLYFTTDNGVLKLSAFNSNVFMAGIPPGLDLTGNFAPADGPIGGDTQVAYRILFGRTDQNNNLLLGAPSDILVLINRPFASASFTTAGAGPFTITINTSVAHNLSTGQVVTIPTGAPTPAQLEGSWPVTVVSASVFTISVPTNPGAGGTISLISVTRETNLEFSVPEEITSTDVFYQVYRSTQSASSSVAPAADFRLIKQQNLTAFEIAENVVFYTDDVLVIFEGAELYTNPNSREGEAQANTQPPLCDDMTLFKNHMLYANNTTHHALAFDLVSTDPSFIVSGNWFEVKEGATTRRYVARTGVGNSTVTAQSVSGTTTITVTYTAHGLINGDTILVSNITGTISPGEYVVSGVTANTFVFTVTVGQTATALDFQGVKNAANEYIFQLVPPGSSPSAGIDATARAIVKAIDRDPSSTVYSKYLSGIADVPGKMYLQAITFTTSPIQLRAQNTTVGQAFNPELPAAFGATVQSMQEHLPNTLYASKVGEPEAVPLVNSFTVGARNAAILRVFALRDSVIILKEDGVWRFDGDANTNFTSTILDGTVICVSPNSAALINNQVVFLSNQGVCLVTSSSVEIISRKIEAPIAAVLGDVNLLASTSAVSYESERLYLLTTLAPNTSTPSVVYCYNTLTSSWTTWDQYFAQGIVGPHDKMFLISLANKIVKERKLQNKLDYTAQDFAITAVSIASDKLSGVFSTGSVTPQVGDVVVFSSIISRIETVDFQAPNYRLGFESITNITASASCVLYQKFKSTIKLSPVHAGMVSRHKRFCQMQIHTKDPSISSLVISFANDTFGGSESVNWYQNTVALQGGWGQLPWGFFPWGLEDGINLTYSTQPAPTIRTYIPLFAQRATFIQPVLEHDAGAEPLHIQAIGFQVQGYNERVSR